MVTPEATAKSILENHLKDLLSSGKSYSFDEIYHELLFLFPFSMACVAKILEELIRQGAVRIDPLYDPATVKYTANFQINV